MENKYKYINKIHTLGPLILQSVYKVIPHLLHPQGGHKRGPINRGMYGLRN